MGQRLRVGRSGCCPDRLERGCALGMQGAMCAPVDLERELRIAFSWVLTRVHRVNHTQAN